MAMGHAGCISSANSLNKQTLQSRSISFPLLPGCLKPQELAKLLRLSRKLPHFGTLPQGMRSNVAKGLRVGMVLGNQFLMNTRLSL